MLKEKFLKDLGLIECIEVSNVDHLITEDDEPLDNILSEKQQRLLTAALYNAWAKPGKVQNFFVAANVGIFISPHLPPVVPDVFVSLNVQVSRDWWNKKNRSYLLWEFGKPPEIAIEIVSNVKGKEKDIKLTDYAHLGISYYVVYNPFNHLKRKPLTIYVLHGGIYKQQHKAQFPGTKLGLVLWEGEFEGDTGTWLRWCDETGNILLTGIEQALKEKEKTLKEEALKEKEEAVQLSQRLMARLRELGQDLESI